MSITLTSQSENGLLDSNHCTSGISCWPHPSGFREALLSESCGLSGQFVVIKQRSKVSPVSASLTRAIEHAQHGPVGVNRLALTSWRGQVSIDGLARMGEIHELET